MASTNQSPFYKKAESMFLQAKTNSEKIKWLEEMIKECPKHKSSEKMLANLKTRHIKLKEKIESQKKSGKGKKQGIKKEDLQVVIVGKTNSGKSSLLKILTNAEPEIADYEFTTKVPILGATKISETPIQLIENPAINSDFYNRGLTNSADTILILINSISEIEELNKFLGNSTAKRIIVFNKSDNFGENEKRKIEATLKSKKYNFAIISSKIGENIEDLKEKIFKSFDKIRVYTKEPGKEKSPKPIILPPESSVADVAEKILHGFASKIKETKIWGPSSKFAGQKVGLKHRLKDLDVVEFKTK